ncbi:MAG: hypothetical protein ABSC31_07560 [Acidimicrobiales bacterium]
MANALGAQASRALDEGRIDWQEVPLGRDDSFPDISVLRWPLRTEDETARGRCAVGWAIGSGTAPSTTFIVDGSSCRLSHVRYYGEVWVASAGV